MIKNKKASGRQWEEVKGILRANYCFPSSNALRLKEESADERQSNSFSGWLWKEYRKEAIHDSDKTQHDICRDGPTAKQLSSYCVYLIQ